MSLYHFLVVEPVPCCNCWVLELLGNTINKTQNVLGEAERKKAVSSLGSRISTTFSDSIPQKDTRGLGPRSFIEACLPLKTQKEDTPAKFHWLDAIYTVARILEQIITSIQPTYLSSAFAPSPCC